VSHSLLVISAAISSLHARFSLQDSGVGDKVCKSVGDGVCKFADGAGVSGEVGISVGDGVSKFAVGSEVGGIAGEFVGISDVDVQTAKLSQFPPVPQQTSLRSSSIAHSLYPLNAHCATASSYALTSCGQDPIVIHDEPSIEQQRTPARNEFR